MTNEELTLKVESLEKEIEDIKLKLAEHLEKHSYDFLNAGDILHGILNKKGE